MEGRVWSPSGMLNFEFEKAVRQWLIGADNVSGSLVMLLVFVFDMAGAYYCRLFFFGHVVA